MTSIFQQLLKGKRKGDNGCIVVIGGSEMYTGAPVFTARGALLSGADMVYVFTDTAALLPIKSIYDAIVLPISFNERILLKATGCVVGPGLGRCTDEKYQAILRILRFLDERSIPIVIDGDAIHYYKHGDLSKLKKCVITPNYKEAEGLALGYGHACVYKGETDNIKSGGESMEVTEPGSGKRCGGQGDILAGVIAVALSLNDDCLLQACLESCILIRKAARKAFKKYGYSTSSLDILEELPKVLKKLLK